jgi:hypothetical protein
MVNNIVLFSYLTLLENDFNYEQFSEILNYDVLIFILLLFFFKVLNYHFNTRFNFTFPFNLSIPLFELYESKENDSYYNLHIIEVILACNKINIQSFLNFKINLFFSHITYEQFIDEFVENYMHLKLFHLISFVNYNETKFVGKVHNLKEFLIFYFIFKKNLKANFEFDLSVCTFLKNSTKSLFKFSKRFFASKIPKLNIKKFYELIKNLAQGNESDEEFISLFYSKFSNFSFMKIIQTFNLHQIDKNFEKVQGISQYFINQQFYKIENIVLNDKSNRFYKITLNFTEINVKVVEYLTMFLKEKNKTNSLDLFYLQIEYFDLYDISIFFDNSIIYFETINLIFLLILFSKNEKILEDNESQIVCTEMKKDKELLDFLINNIEFIKNSLKLSGNQDIINCLKILKGMFIKKSIMILNDQIKRSNETSETQYYYLFKKISLFLVLNYNQNDFSSQCNLKMRKLEMYFQPHIDNYNNLPSIFNDFKEVKKYFIKLLTGNNCDTMNNISENIKLRLYFKFFDNISYISSQNPYLQVLINDIITNFLQLIHNDLIENLIKFNSPNLKVKFSIFQVMLSITILRKLPKVKLTLENIFVESFSVLFLRSFILSLDEIGLNYDNITHLEINPTHRNSLYKNKTDFRLENVLESLAFRAPIPIFTFSDPNFTIHKDTYLEFIMEKEGITTLNFKLEDIHTLDDVDIIVNMLFQILYEGCNSSINEISIYIFYLSTEFASVCYDSLIRKILKRASERSITYYRFPKINLHVIVDKSFFDSKNNIQNIEGLLKINSINCSISLTFQCRTEIVHKQIKDKKKSFMSFKPELSNTTPVIRLFSSKVKTFGLIGKKLSKKRTDKKCLDSFLTLLSVFKLNYDTLRNEKILRVIWEYSKNEYLFEINY